MNISRIPVSITVLMLASSAWGETISISAGELENLGVRFETAGRVAEVPGIQATARVAIPPAGDAIIASPFDQLISKIAAFGFIHTNHGTVRATFGKQATFCSEIPPIPTVAVKVIRAQVCPDCYIRGQAAGEVGLI